MYFNAFVCHDNVADVFKLCSFGGFFNKYISNYYDELI